MKKATLAGLILLLCSAWALAQYGSSQGSQSSSSGETSVKGCLAKSDSGYALTDKSGTTYQLTGDTSQLSAHVGHEIQIKGTKAEASAASSGSSSQPQLQVSSMKHISETCISDKSKSGSSSMSEKLPSDKPEKPMSEKPPQK